MTEDDYSVVAGYYDEAYASKEALQDVPFYVELAKDKGGPMLEIGCGTGRVLLPTAREGIAIDGLDFSPVMLNVLEKHLSNESPEVSDKVTLHQGDMRDFNLNKKYKLATIPFRPMQHMFTLDDQLAALKSAKNHLAPDGSLVFDVFFPLFSAMNIGDGKEHLDLEWISKENPDQIIKRYFIKDSFDKINQHFTGRLIFRTYENEKLVKEVSENLKMNFYTYQHLRLLFRMSGLEVVAEYGAFDKSPLDENASEMIFELRAG